MAPETRSQDVRRMEDSLEAANQRINGIEVTVHALSDDMTQLKAMVKEMAIQQGSIKQTLQILAGEASSSQSTRVPQQVAPANNHEWVGDGTQPNFKSRRPRRDFPTFEGEDVHKWLYRCNQYFDLEEIPEMDKLKLASYYLDGMALYWHQNYTRNLEGQEVTWTEYVDALCCRFGGQKDPLEELTEHKQGGDLEGYIRDFDMLWNRAQISEKQALVFFLGGLEIEIKNLVKMFEPKSLKQAYNLARLHNNTLTYRKVTPIYPKSQPARFNYSANSPQTNLNLSKPPLPALLPTPTSPPYNNHRPTKPIRTKAMDERRAKGLCFWYDEKFVHGHRCRNRKMYSLCIIEDDGDSSEGEEPVEAMEFETLTPHLSIQAIQGTSGCQTIKVWGKIGRYPIFILIDSGSTHNFLNAELVNKLGCSTSPIKPLAVEAANGGTMSCTALCKNLQWKMQGTQFEADVFVMKLQSYDMVLGIQWLKLLGDVLSNYEERWVSFWWQNKKVTLKGEDPKLAQSIPLEELNGLLSTKALLSEVKLCSLQMVEESDREQQVKELPIFEDSEGSPLQSLLAAYQHIFCDPKGLPPARRHDHKIPLKDESQTINLRSYRYSGLQKDTLETLVAEMLEAGLVQPSNSPFASPVVLVKKKDNTWRFCVDYRALNKITVKDKYPIPIIDELLEELQGAAIFSKIDLRAGYHQIRMVPGDVLKTVFRTHNGHYEFLVMPFGLSNAPATFQSLMNDIFRDHLRKFILVFFDDILVYSRAMAEHLVHLGVVFEILGAHQLVAKKSKCVFGAGQMEYLGHVISKEGVTTDPLKVTAISQWPIPKTIKQLRGFLGLTGYYRKFVKGYGSICRPLTQLLQKDSFVWTEAATTAFNQLKLAMSHPLVLALPDFEKTFVIETDASGVGIGAVLMQEGHPIAFVSKALGPRQLALSTYERELLAIVYAVTKWKHYLWGKKFLIRTDHSSLRFMLTQKATHVAQQVWLTKLLGFDYDIEYRKGKENLAADALSRISHQELSASTLSSVSTTILADIRKTWETDHNLKKLILELHKDTGSHPNYSWVNNTLLRKGKVVVG